MHVSSKSALCVEFFSQSEVCTETEKVIQFTIGAVETLIISFSPNRVSSTYGVAEGTVFP